MGKLSSLEENGMTREEYMSSSREDGKKAHMEYYGQFVTPYIRHLVSRKFGDRLNHCTEHFNEIPLEEWDVLAGGTGSRSSGKVSFPADLAVSLKSVGDFMTLSVAVCILKEAARQIKDGFS